MIPKSQSKEPESQDVVRREDGRRDRSSLPKGPGEVEWEVTCPQTHHCISGGRGTCCGEGFLPSTKTLPLSAHLPFFYCASWDLPVCLAATGALCVCPFTLNRARAPHLTVHTGTLALQLLAQF